jgi:tRNA modification GTPase
MSTRSETTRVTQLTPPGRAAVAVVLVEGPEATELVDAALRRADGKRLTEFPFGRIVIGRWAAPEGEELVVCRRAPEAVEVHCHGGTAAAEAVIGRLRGAGCESIAWQDWVRLTSTDPICAAAQIALADAPTQRTAAILLDQFQGALSDAIRQVVTAAENGDWPTAVSILKSILARRATGLHLTKPWRVVLAGRPNVGKSSLLNALVGFERAIVYDWPGTTRDVITALTAIDGWPVLLSDTAGLRDARDEIEAAGVERATAAAAEADLVLLVSDAPHAAELLLSPTVPTLRVLNKLDLHPALEGGERERFDACVSALDGTGIEALAAAIVDKLMPTPPAAGDPLAFSGEQFALLDAGLAAARRHEAPAVNHCLLRLIQ